MMDTIITTVLHRPYVFAFLIAFLILGRLHFGWKKTFLWLIVGYAVAWASEFSSIHNGFPYGMYHYVYENLQGELLVAGVPFWDSLSYPFMIFAGYTTAEFILGASHPDTPYSKSTNMKTIALGAFLTMLLDVIIDPLTVMGDKWFLGRVYYYPDAGQYFGVPLTNFAGWFVVPLAVIMIFIVIARSKPRAGTGDCFADARNDRLRLRHFLNPLFYLSIAVFNIAITVWINEPILASVDCFILIPIVGLILWRVKKLTAPTV